MNLNMVRHGFVLILIAFVSGLFVSVMEVPRLGLSAHTIAILGGVLLIAIGAVWPVFSLSAWQKQGMYWSWLYANYVNWLACFVGAFLGAGGTTPVASGGLVGTPFVESVVAILLGSVAITSFVAAGLSLWGLRPRGESVT